ncbi:MAG: PHP domain-containing protein [Ruminococcus sp.]|nr:PHP domain-containing protein [Ruminococcus sp.]
MICDLHCHTKLSDGSLGIEDVIAQAQRTGVEWLSITDHDTMASFSRADVLANRAGIKILHGVELSAWDKERGRKVHVLCYNPQKPDRLEGLCLKCCEIRKQTSKEMIEKVMAKFPITLESILKHTTSSKSIFKQHIMRALIDYGYALEFYGELDSELFNPKTGSCYVEREYPDVNFVIDLIHLSGGAAVLAHPAQYDNIELLEDLAENGRIDGVEIGHYSADEAYRDELRKIADKYELIRTGGSDFHGLYNSVPTHLGSESTEFEEIERIIKLTARKK